MKTRKFLSKCSKYIPYLKSKFYERVEPPILIKSVGLADVFSVLSEADKIELRNYISNELPSSVMTGNGANSDDPSHSY